jgi:hypothetical protein
MPQCASIRSFGTWEFYRLVGLKIQKIVDLKKMRNCLEIALNLSWKLMFLFQSLGCHFHRFQDQRSSRNAESDTDLELLDLDTVVSL